MSGELSALFPAVTFMARRPDPHTHHATMTATRTATDRTMRNSASEDWRGGPDEEQRHVHRGDDDLPAQ